MNFELVRNSYKFKQRKKANQSKENEVAIFGNRENDMAETAD